MFDLLATPTRRKLLFSLLYLSEGAPIGFIWIALPTRLHSDGLPVDQITWLAGVLVLPWTFKFLWAPLVDALQSRWWNLRHWIVAAQTLMGLTLLPLLWLGLETHFSLLAGLLLAHAFAAATQDVAIDALCIRVTHPEERGRLNGWMQAGMLLGKAGLGGGALMLSRWLGWQGVILLLIGVVWSSLLLLLATRLPSEVTGRSPSLRNSLNGLATSARLAARQPATWLALLFALVGGAAYEGLGVIVGPLLLSQGFVEHQVGFFLAVPVLLATLFGSLAGGRLADLLDRRAAVAISLLIVLAAAAQVGVSVGPLAEAHVSEDLLLGSLTAVYFGIGLFVASSYALLMDLTTPGIAATQFSAFMGATNGCESWCATAIGMLSARHSYATGIWLMCVPSLAALLLLPWLVPKQASPVE